MRNPLRSMIPAGWDSPRRGHERFKMKMSRRETISPQSVRLSASLKHSSSLNMLEHLISSAMLDRKRQQIGLSSVLASHISRTFKNAVGAPCTLGNDVQHILEHPMDINNMPQVLSGTRESRIWRSVARLFPVACRNRE